MALELGRYRLVERLAVGGMAELFRATIEGAHDFHKAVVIKRILPHLAANAKFVDMFIDEAKLTAQLMHPKIVQVYELGMKEGELFIAMEYVEGIDVLDLLRSYADRGRRIPPEIAVHILHEVTDALDFAHTATDDSGRLLDIVHRDVSPGNILLSKRGSVKLTDFGIARAAALHGTSEEGTLKGKYGYMSPEQVVRAKLDGRSDLFSCGVVLAELLLGQRLFAARRDADVLRMVRDVDLTRYDRRKQEIHRELRWIIERALRRDPRNRFPDARTFREALADWLFRQRLRVGPEDVSRVVAEILPERKRRMPTPTAVESTETGGESGEFSEISPMHVFYDLAVTRATGLLEVARGSVQKRIYFREGKARNVETNADNERVGQLLVGDGAVDEGELAMALAVQSRFRGRLVETMVTLGLLEADAAIEALESSLRARLVDVCTWQRGTFSWHPEAEATGLHERVALDPFEFLGAGAMALERQAVEEWSNQRLDLTPRALANSRVSPDAFRLGPRPAEIHRLLDGDRTLGELAELFPSEAIWLDARRILMLLEQTELAALERRPPRRRLGISGRIQ